MMGVFFAALGGAASAPYSVLHAEAERALFATGVLEQVNGTLPGGVGYRLKVKRG